MVALVFNQGASLAAVFRMYSLQVQMLLHADLLVLEIIECRIRCVVGNLIILRFIANSLPRIAAVVIDSLLGKYFSTLFRVRSVAEIHCASIDISVIDTL